MNEAIDFNTLKWLKQELDQTLTQARQALEAHVEDSDDIGSLNDCAAHLHQVTGTLQMVQLYGAVLLAEEMEALAGSLVDRSVAQTDAAHEILMRALLQLPDYLERLINGYRDIPLVLLPLLNDMRAVRGENLLSENALFQPDLARPLPESIRVCEEPDTDIVELARGLRHKFQLALLGWFRDQESCDSLQGMAEVVDSLRRASRFEPVSRLWWVSGGVISALHEERLAPSMATRLLMGQIDREIKRLIEAGEESLAAEPAVELLKNLLFYVGRATQGDERIDEIRSVYSLERLLPAGEELEEARQSLHGHNAELMDTVSVAIKEDIAKVKDNLDLFIRNRDKAPEELEGSVAILRRVADTLGMLGMGSLRQTMQVHADLAAEMASGDRQIEEDGLMEVAQAMLIVETSLDGLSAAGAPNTGFMSSPDIASSDLGVPDVELGQVKGVVAEEALRDLALAKDAIAGFAGAREEFGLLESVPQLLNQIRGGLLLLNETRAAGLIDSVARYVSTDLLEEHTSPEDGTLEWLADAVSSLEYYLENLCESRVLSGTVLDVAATSVERLGYPADTEIPAVAETDDLPAVTNAEVVCDDAPRTDAVDDLAGQEPLVTDSSVAPVVAETDTPEILETMEVVGADTAEQAPEYSSDQFEPPQAVAEVPQAQESHKAEEPDDATGAAECQYPVMEGEPDEEILEIFLEEAEEELAGMAETLPRWIDNADDKESLGNIRRSFHTIKGSGRIVGALRIGEFAWSFEDMLNRVIDGTVDRSEAICGLLQQAMEVLPQLVEEIRAGKPSARAEGLMAKAAAASRGEDIPEVAEDIGTPQHSEEAATADVVLEIAFEPEVEAESEAEGETDVPPVDQEEDGADEVLTEIFVKEAKGHLATLHNCLDNYSHDTGIAASEELRRALHTLHGSAYMAGVLPVAEIAEVADRYVKDYAASELNIPAEACEVLRSATTTVESMIDCVENSCGDMPDYQEIAQLVTALPAAPDHIDVQGATVPAVEEVPDSSAVDDTPAEIPVAAGPDEENGNSAGPDMGGMSPGAGTGIDDAQASGDMTSAGDSVEYSDLDDELVEVFLEEGGEIIEGLEPAISGWIKDPGDAELMAALQRDLHTLKGGARMASLMSLGNLCHSLETVLQAVVEGRVMADTRLFDLVQATQDHIVEMLEAVRRRAPIASPQAIMQGLESLLAGLEPDSASSIAEMVVPDAVAGSDQESAEEAVEESALAATTGAEPVTDRTPKPPREEWKSAGTARAPQELVRIRADLLDDMVNFAGEISIYRSRLDQQVGSFRFNLVELGQTVDRLRDQLRKLEIETDAQVLFRYEKDDTNTDQDFDPLEMDRYSHIQQLSRSLVESISDLSSIQALLDNINRESETLLLQQSRVNTELQEGLMRTRMVPFSGLAPRMRRIVRQACKELGKRAELELEGAEGEMDRTVIDRVIAPIEHMLRNAIAHGIESPDERREAGKPEIGTISIELTREGSEVVIRIADDGRGMNLQAIRAKARDRGLITDDRELSDNDVMQFVLETGFSTAETVTQISGRGVGMDVVNSEIKQLGGTLHIGSKEGRGTDFTIRLPFTLSITQALMVQVYEEIFAIPLSSVEGIVRMESGEIQRYYADQSLQYEYAGASYSVQYLGNIIGRGMPAMPNTSERLPVLLVRAGDQRVALQVDGLLGSRETVVKSVGAQISTVRGVSGATILGDGRVVLILDPSALLRRTAAANIPAMQPADAMEPDTDRALTVMVVDDSITVRKVTTRLLERNDFSVVTAKDGVDAVAKLQEVVPDVMLLDIEMPRMDGYELATHIRNDQRLQNIPIVMITSRTGDKHRNRAMEIGVNEYLGKPYQESDLLKTITGLLEARLADGTRGAS